MPDGADQNAANAANGPSRAASGLRMPGQSSLERAIAGVVEETIVRTVESDAVVKAIERILTDGRLQEAVEHSIDDEQIEQAVRRALDSAVADHVWEDVLASDKAQMLVERIAGAPEVRAALAQQGFGLLTDLGRQVSKVTTGVDDWLERVVRVLSRRPRRQEPTNRAGFVTRAVAAAVDGGLLAGGFTISGNLLGSILPIGGGLGLFWFIVVVATIAFTSGAYFILFWGLEGQTPGMRFIGIVLQDPEGNHRIGPRRAQRRMFGVFLSTLTLGLGFLGVLFSDRRRSLADVIAGTEVAYDEEGTFAPWSVNEIPGAPG